MRHILVAAVILAACPAGAEASTITATQVGEVSGSHGDGRFLSVVLTAAPGEANDIALRATRGTVTATDQAGLLAGSGCVQVDEHTARCSADVPGASASVFAGDESDRVDTGPLPGGVDGGPGNDDLLGEYVDFVGGAGDDHMVGGKGSGQDFTGDGPGAPPGDDVMISGGGVDARVNYRERTAPVTVDLAAGVGGQAGEHDVIENMKRVDGGKGADVLLGDDGPNDLSGGAGSHIEGRGGRDSLSAARDAVILGGSGDDVVYGGAGHDLLDGGPGDDKLSPGSPTDELACGPGADRVIAPYLVPVIPADCEMFDSGPQQLSVVRRAGALRVRVYGGYCQVRITARDERRRTIGVAHMPTSPLFRLTAVGRRVLKQPHPRVHIVARDYCRGYGSLIIANYIALL